MLRLEISDDVLIRAVSDAVEKQLSRVNDYSGYVDLKGACKFLSVGESQFKEWVRLAYIHPRKISSHLVRYRLKELEAFMEDFLVKSRAKPRREFFDHLPVPDCSSPEAESKTIPLPVVQ